MKRGPKPVGKAKRRWSSDFAYAVGLLTADGCLSKDGRHISLTSTDKAQISLFKKCLGIKTKTAKKYSGSGDMAYCTQFGDVLLYRFLLGIGLTPAKSKTLESVAVPDVYFMDFARGYFDGDGCSYSYYDPVFKNSYRFYISFTSASPIFVDWFRAKITRLLRIRGSVGGYTGKSYVQLRYAKKEAIVLAQGMYYTTPLPHLRRKYLKIRNSLRIIRSCPGGEIGRRATFRS